MKKERTGRYWKRVGIVLKKGRVEVRFMENYYSFVVKRKSYCFLQTCAKKHTLSKDLF